MNSGSRQTGFTYLGALALVAALGTGLAAIGELWSHSRQREKEAELLWIGNQFKQAIGLYYHRTPGAVKQFPEKLEDLLEDRRFPNPQRYLRRIYADPITGRPDWSFVMVGGRIQGLHSSSATKPRREMPNVATYSEWRFVYDPSGS